VTHTYTYICMRNTCVSNVCHVWRSQVAYRRDDESCLIDIRVMSHMCKKHVSYTYGSWLIYVWVTSHIYIYDQCLKYEGVSTRVSSWWWVMSYRYMSHVSYRCMSHVSYICMSNVSCMKASNRVSSWWWVMSHRYTSHVSYV